MSSIDHLVVGSQDLTSLAAWWLDAAGEPADPGGAHVGRGTRNELVGLGATSYLELIGPDPDQPDHVGPRSFGVDQLTGTQPVLVTFAVGVDDLVEARAICETAGVATTEPFAMERVTPTGDLLSWRLSLPIDDVGGTVPFLIEWGPTTPHPAQSLAHRSRLTALQLRHPRASFLSDLFERLGVDVGVIQGPPGLSATLSTPAGAVVLSS